MVNQLNLAIEIATAAHGGQKYSDTEPYTVHLAAVAAVLLELKCRDDEMQAAAWLHDVLEDTEETPVTLLTKGVCVRVLALVDAVTNRPGRNRADRHVKTYSRMRYIPDAVLLKLADRIANVRASHINRRDLLKMYRREQNGFISALWMKEHGDAWKLLQAALYPTGLP